MIEPGPNALPPNLLRYARQAVLPEIGLAGQQAISRARVTIVGLGALGSACADILARAGVGSLTLVDRDLVEQTNLQRQTLYAEADVGEPKAVAAVERLRRVNSTITLNPRVMDVNPRSVAALIDDSPEILVDGSDNFALRYLLNDLAVRERLPLVYGGVLGFDGAVHTFMPGKACLRCVFPDPPPPGSQPTCDTAGVFGPAVSIVAALQARDVILLAAGRGDLLAPSLETFRLTSHTRQRLDLSMAKRSDCPCCGERRFEFLSAPVHDELSLCGQDAIQIAPAPTSIDLASLEGRLRVVARVVRTKFLLRATFAPGESVREITVFADGRTLIAGTRDPAVARAAYARFIGH